MTEDMDFKRRFGGVTRLYGEAGLAKLQAAHVVVVGAGGVGSWAAEAMARHAVGTITLIDLDNVAESNFNRQLHALDGNIGKAKITAMRERILQINPLCRVNEIEDFITPENIDTLLHFSADLVLDCIDDAKAKIALAVYCKAKQIPLVMSGSAGGRLDAKRIQTADLSQVTGDKLLAKVRNQLRRDHQFPKASNTKKSAKFGIACVYSDEIVLRPQTNPAKSTALQPNNHAGSGDAFNEPENCSITGLNCAGYGSSVCVTAPFGFIAAGLALQRILDER
jgi:tRNA A37 threonylcarbamoyladenosine dehydratase